MHKVGGGSGSDGYWHIDYEESEQEVKHRHAWPDELHKITKREYVARVLREYKETCSCDSLTKSNGNEKSLGVEGSVSGAAKLFGTGVETGLNVGSTKSDNTSTATTNSGPNQKQMDAVAKKAGAEYEKNKTDLAERAPNIICYADKPMCGSSSGPIPNEDYRVKEESKKSESTETKSGPKQPSSNDHKSPTPNSSSSENGPKQPKASLIRSS